MKKHRILYQILPSKNGSLSHSSLTLKFLPLAAEHRGTVKGDIESIGCVHRALGEGGGAAVLFSAAGREREERLR